MYNNSSRATSVAPSLLHHKNVKVGKVLARMNFSHCKNKAGYTATLVACGWAGAAKKAKRDGPTDRPTDGQSGS